MGRAKHEDYPWDEWFEYDYGETFTLKQGRDYHCPSYSLAQQIRNKLHTQSFRSSIQIDENRLLVTWIKGKKKGGKNA